MYFITIVNVRKNRNHIGFFSLDTLDSDIITGMKNQVS